MRLRYILMFLLVTSPVTPIHGQTTPRSNTVSRTQLLADSTQMLVQRVYDNGLGDVTRKFGVKPSELAREQVLYKDSTDYLFGGSLVMRNGKVDKLYFEGGFARAFETGSATDRFAFYYFNQDHLGNNREVVNAKAVSQVTNYYPFGAPYADEAATKGADFQLYKYNGKELDKMHGLNTYDYGARQYDPILARWDRVDPLAEKYYGISPYAYCANNPVKFVDPDGKQIMTPIPMFGFTDILTFGRLDVIMADGGKIVEVQGRVASSSKQIHHWIPRQFKNHPTVEKAIRGGYKFEGKENKSPLNTFSKSTGKAQHANHPKYNQQIKNKLDNIDKGLSSKQTARAVRHIKNSAKKAVEKNPNQKVNDVKIK